jgi:hypothetical protein
MIPDACFRNRQRHSRRSISAYDIPSERMYSVQPISHQARYSA